MMSVLENPVDNIYLAQEIVRSKKPFYEKPWRQTPFIGTINEGDVITEIDIESFIEAGLKIFRFHMTITMEEKMRLMGMLKTALAWCCEKYDVSTWPIASVVDIPNACIKTGVLAEPNEIYLKENHVLELTSDIKYINSCSKHRIFIDDPFTMKDVKPGAEIAIRFGEIVMNCMSKIDSQTITCKVIRGGTLGHEEFVCIRGIKHMRPALTKADRDILQFAKEMKFDIVTINSLRNPRSLRRIREYFPKDQMPLFVSTICEQEGLDNIEEIIKESDGIILAREFLACEIMDKHQMTAVQMHVSALCRKFGKPFYISGNILLETITTGNVAICEMSDVTNAVLQGAGFVLRRYKNPTHLAKVLGILNSVCRTVEPLTRYEGFWRLSSEFHMPVNAAEAAVLSSALLAMQTDSSVIIIPTVTGRTAKQIAHVSPGSIIITISTNPLVAKQLQFYRGIMSIIYDKPPKKDWFQETESRLKFAVVFGVKQNILQYGQTYVVLRKASPSSCFCDQVSTWTVETEEIAVNRLPMLNATSILSL